MFTCTLDRNVFLLINNSYLRFYLKIIFLLLISFAWHLLLDIFPSFGAEAQSQSLFLSSSLITKFMRNGQQKDILCDPLIFTGITYTNNDYSAFLQPGAS